MTSSTLYYWLGRWGLIVVAFLLGVCGAFAAYHGDGPVAFGYTAAFVGLLAFALWLHDRIAVVTLAEGGVEVRGGGGVEHYRWGDIASVSQVRRTAPPVYRVDFRDEGPSVYCVVPEFYVAVEFFGFHEVEDFSGFGAYAKRQILRAGIEAEKERMMTEQRG